MLGSYIDIEGDFWYVDNYNINIESYNGICLSQINHGYMRFNSSIFKYAILINLEK